MADLTGIGDILAGSAGLLGTAYNLYTNKRDFDYQKALQQTMFEREDTAVQRRMADLKAAGINPNLAAGSAASAGAVVSRSNTNDVNMGAALDTLMAKRQLEMQKLQQDNVSQDTKIKHYQFELGLEDFKMQRLQNLYALGFNPKVSFDSDGKIHVNADKKTNVFGNTQLAKTFDYQVNSLKNSADLLQKDNDWYTADKVSGMALGLLGSGTSFLNYKKFFGGK